MSKKVGLEPAFFHWSNPHRVQQQWVCEARRVTNKALCRVHEGRFSKLRKQRLPVVIRPLLEAGGAGEERV